MTLFWLLPLAKRLFGIKRLKPRRRARPRGRLGLEVLEDRLVPAPFIVEVVDDNGNNAAPLAKSLRMAVKEVSLGNKDGIEFNSGAGIQTIKIIKTALLPIARPVVIDGRTVPGQIIRIEGVIAGNDALPAGAVGLTFARDGANSADNSQILGLTIDNFPGDGIRLNNVGNVRIGFRTAGGGEPTLGAMTVIRNGFIPAPDTTTGGIHITGAQAVNNTVLGSFIGTNANSEDDLGNSNGIRIDGNASGNNVGGMGTGERNIISGNGVGVLGSGIDITRSNSNTVVGNYIGTRANSKDKLPNFIGVSINNGSSNTIGGEAPTVAGVIETPANVISGNTSGLGILGALATNNKVYGNFIGTDKTGLNKVGNETNGVVLTAGASQNFIGGPTAGKRNVISANGFGEDALHGIRVANSTKNRIENNNIGLGPKREAPGIVLLPNAGDAVNYAAAATDNIIKNTKFAQDAAAAIKDNGQRNKVLDPNSILGQGPAIDRGTMEGAPEPTSAAVSPRDPMFGTDATIITGTLSHAPRSEYILEFFGNTVRNRQAERFLGNATVLTDSLGMASFRVTFGTVYGGFVTATSTGTASDGFTSEVSFDIPLIGRSPTATVGDRIWIDMDGDGLQDPEELARPLPKDFVVTVALYTAEGRFVASTTTDATGWFVFTGVAPGDYYLQFGPPPSGYDFTLAYQGDSIYDSDADPFDGATAIFTLIEGQVETTFDAGYIPLSEGAARRYRGPRRR